MDLILFAVLLNHSENFIVLQNYFSCTRAFTMHKVLLNISLIAKLFNYKYCKLGCFLSEWLFLLSNHKYKIKSWTFCWIVICEQLQVEHFVELLPEVHWEQHQHHHLLHRVHEVGEHWLEDQLEAKTGQKY